MRLAVYTDYAYHRLDGEVYAERAFALFVAGLREQFSSLLLVGRLNPPGGEARYSVGRDVDFLALPFYPNLARVFQTIPALARSLTIFWRLLADVDCVWLLGPHPLALAFAVMALARRKRVVLGVRQDLPAYVRNRHPRRPALWLMGWLLEGGFRILALRVPVVAVGPELAHHYRRARARLEITVSLVASRDLVAPHAVRERRFDGELRLLAVGRLEQEKNPLLLAEVLAILNCDEPRWRLLVCGEGELREPLEARLTALGERGNADLLGYVPFGEQLNGLYRGSHVLLHTSWTEGLPAVLPEAFAAGLPAVAADVGGIARAVGDAALLVPAGDAAEAARAVKAIRDDPLLRARLVEAGHAYAAAHTVEAETRKLAGFLRSA